MKKKIQLFKIIITNMILLILFTGSSKDLESKALKSQVRVYIIKTLESTLSQIEKEATKQVNSEKQDQVKNTTLKLQNYLEDVVLAYGKEVVIFPNEILELIVTMANSGKTRNEISTKLREYMESKI
jgi:hypothetical protein